jgi:hypothetical protein
MIRILKERNYMAGKYKKFIVEALLGFIMWTGFLTPYMILVTGLSIGQYLYWVLMQAILVPPLSIVVINITNKIVNKLRLD